MATKKKATKSPAKAKVKVPDEVLPVEEKVAATPVSADTPPEDPYDGKLYTISLWKHLNNYECLACAYATIDRADALRHFMDEHAPIPEPVRIVDTGLVSESGAPIQRVEPAKEE